MDSPTPYVSSIDEGQFVPGRLIKVQGMAPGNAQRFSLNLQCSEDVFNQRDIALKISVHLKDGYIALNSLQNKSWDSELRGPLLPIESAKKFEVVIECELNKYKVTINDQHYCDFPQRIHYDDITHLVIDGDVIISKIAYETITKASNKPKLSNNANTAMIGFKPISFSPGGIDSNGYDNSECPVKRRRSYEAAIYATQGGYVGAPYAASTTTATDSPRGSPLIATSYPGNGNNGDMCMIDVVEDNMTQSTAQLNKEPSDLKPVSDSDDMKRCCANCCGFLIGGLFILGFVLLYI